MDVRCEKCQTEYELDEAKVSETGVTVKCTNCGYLFRVRRRAASVEGARAGERLWMIRNPSGEIRKFRELTTLQQWIVERKVTRDCEISRTGETWKRLGDIAELASFFLVVDQAQAARAASAAAGTRSNTLPYQSRPLVAPANVGAEHTPTPTKGYPLAAETAGAARTVPTGDDARRVKLPAVDDTPTKVVPNRTMLGVPPLGASLSPSAPPAASSSPPPAAASAVSVSAHASAARAPVVPAPASAAHAATIPVTQAPAPASAAHAATIPAAQAPVAPAAPAPAAPMAAAPSGPTGPLPSSAPAALAATLRLAPDGPGASREGVPRVAADEPSGPTGGLSGAPTVEPAFALGARTGVLSLPEAADDDDWRPPRSRAPFYVLLVALLAAGAVGGYFVVAKLVARPRPEAASMADAGPPAPIAEAPVVTPIPQNPEPAPSPAPPTGSESPAAQAYAAALAKLDEDTDEAFAAAEKILEKARSADPAEDARALAAMALVNSSWAQYLFDDAEAAGVADPRKAEQLRAEAQRKLARAEQFAADSLRRHADNPDGLVARADALRQKKGVRVRDVEALLAKAAAHPEAPYVRAMLLLREGKRADALPLLSQASDRHRAEVGREHMRARYRLAALAVAESRWEDAKAAIALLVAAQPGHARARALEARVAEATAAAATPPAGAAPPAPAPSPAGGPAASEPEPGGGDVDALLSRAHRLAENDRCPEAKVYYEKVLDVRPGHVEALTGLGYCHLDAGEFASAQAKFRAALGVSPRYGDALIGIAEAYQFQGLTDQAALAYQKYLEIHPDGPKATQARRFVEAHRPVAPAAGAPPVDAPPAGKPEPPPEPPSSEAAPSAPSPTPPAPAEPAPAETPTEGGGKP